MNKPYVKQYKKEIKLIDGIEYTVETEEIENLITKDKPYLHNEKSRKGNSKKLYNIIRNHITGEFMGKMKMFGNNRKNTSKRKNKNSRDN